MWTKNRQRLGILFKTQAAPKASTDLKNLLTRLSVKSEQSHITVFLIHACILN